MLTVQRCGVLTAQWCDVLTVQRCDVLTVQRCDVLTAQRCDVLTAPEEAKATGSSRNVPAIPTGPRLRLLSGKKRPSLDSSRVCSDTFSPSSLLNLFIRTSSFLSIEMQFSRDVKTKLHIKSLNKQ